MPFPFKTITSHPDGSFTTMSHYGWEYLSDDSGEPLRDDEGFITYVNVDGLETA